MIVRQVSRAAELLNSESKEHGLIVEREGKYLPVFDEPRRTKSQSKSQTSHGELSTSHILLYTGGLVWCDWR